MNPVAWLLSFALPACGYAGAAGVPPPVPDLLHIERPSSPNTALAAPAGFSPAPDVVTPTYAAEPAALLAALARVAAAQPRVFLLAQTEARVDWVARSRIANFPDEVSAQATPAEGGGSSLVLYSRSIYGYSDLGVNRKRIDAWLAALDAALKG
jgi:uncharacterized protein (DUF1499 family)